MKIFQIMTRLAVGGAANYGILLTSHLNRRGHEACLVNGTAGKDEGEMQDYLDPSLVDFRQIRIPELGREIGAVRDLIAFWRLFLLFRRERPDVVHTHLSKEGFLGRSAAIAAGVPLTVHSLHGTVFDGYFEGLKAKIFLALEQMLGSRCDCIFTDTELVRRQVIAYRIAPPERVRVVPIGLELDQFADLTPFRGVLRRHLGLKEGTRLVGLIARLVPIKGVEYFLEAAREVLQRRKDVHFVIVGGGELRSALTRRASELGISDRVTFVGFWRDLREIYADVEVMALSSLSEGCPVAVLESMAAGVPVVASAVGGVPDVVEDGVNGLLFPARDAHRLAEGVLQLLSDPERARRLTEAARRHVLVRYTIVASAAETEGLYRTLFPGPWKGPRDLALRDQNEAPARC